LGGKNEAFFGGIKMKKAIWTVIAVGFLAVSCGNGNIKMVQNGVFGNYDKTITVGNAIENNKILKGGKWKAIKIDGRDFVTYTVNLKGEKLQELISAALPTSTSEFRGKPNYWAARQFRNNLSKWRGVSRNAEVLGNITSMSAEEINQARDIFDSVLETNEQRPKEDDFFDHSGVYEVLDMYSNRGKINDDFIDPYLLTIEKESINEYNISRSIDDLVYNFVRHSIPYGDPNHYLQLQIENGMFTSDLQSEYDRLFGRSKYVNNTDFINALIRTRTKFYDWYIKNKTDYENAWAEYNERQKNDIAPMLTIDGFEMVLSFVMNQDDTFSVNKMETYTDVTLNCFNDLKVRYNAGNSENAQNILNYIYRGFRPDLF
jgi:hypothetical protein